jgi:hypothetical protein
MATEKAQSSLDHSKAPILVATSQDNPCLDLCCRKTSTGNFSAPSRHRSVLQSLSGNLRLLHHK